MRTRTYTLLQSDLPPAFQSFSFNFQVFRLKQGFCAITDVANEKEIQPASRPCLPACSLRRARPPLPLCHCSFLTEAGGGRGGFLFSCFNSSSYRRGGVPLLSCFPRYIPPKA